MKVLLAWRCFGPAFEFFDFFEELLSTIVAVLEVVGSGSGSGRGRHG